MSGPAKVGLAHLDGWKTELQPLVGPWVESLRGGEKHRAQAKAELERALEELKLFRAADLDALGVLDTRLRAIERQGVSRSTLRRSYQDVLRRFSKWLAGNRRYLDRDPLREWELLDAPRARVRKGRACEPAEIARAFLALDRLDELRESSHRQRVVFTTLLVTAPRVEAFVSRDVENFLSLVPRLDLGEGPETKRRGRAALDLATAEELRAYVAGRTEGPLFLSPGGRRWRKEKLLDRWREAFGLGLVDALWPTDEPPDLELAHAVNQALIHGRPRTSKGGNPRVVKDDTRRRELELAQRVLSLADRMRDAWQVDMRGVTLHGFRSTFKTWCAGRGVPGPAVDVQLGWESDDDPHTRGVMKLVAGARTGRRHYLDRTSSLLAPESAAAVVREILDEALEALRGRSSMLVRQPTTGQAESTG